MKKKYNLDLKGFLNFMKEWGYSSPSVSSALALGSENEELEVYSFDNNQERIFSMGLLLEKYSEDAKAWGIQEIKRYIQLYSPKNI